MDDTLLETWNRVADGDTEDVDVRAIQRKLLYICFEKAGDPDPEERLNALKVASHFTDDDRMRLADPMVRDKDPRVRRYAFNLAVEAHKAGITTLKTAVGGSDAALAVEALGLLITQVDVTSSLHARQWLRADDPHVRAGAAILLGHIAGPAIGVQLGRMAQNDPVHGVRVHAAEAARRCAGEIPKNLPQDFWVAGPAPIVLEPEPVAIPDPVPTPAPPPRAADPVLPPPPRLPGQGLPTIYPDTPAEAATTLPPPPDEPVPSPPAPQQAAIVPSAPDAPEDVRETSRDWRDPAPLPHALPSEPGALIKLAGMVGVGDRAAVHAAFMATPEGDRNTALRAWMPGGDPKVGRGIAILLSEMKQNRSASMLRHMLSDPDAGVRAGAAEAVGAIGSLSMIPPLSGILADREPAVRAAAVRGLSALLSRTERFAMLRERITPLAEDDDPAVRKAANDALEAIA